MAKLELWIEGVQTPLSVRHFAIRESVSDPFSVLLTACSSRADLDWEEPILRACSFAMEAGWAFVEQGGARRYTGLCQSFEQIQVEPSGLSTYAIHVVPRLWLLTEQETCRIVQHRSIPEIITAILKAHQIVHQWRIDRDSFPRLNYKVQFNESDYTFLSRLCEEGGITYTFEHDEQTGSIMVLSDAPCTASPRNAPPLRFVDKPNQSAEQEFVTGLRVVRGARAGAVAIGDYDFRNPTLPLGSQALRADNVESLLEKFRYEAGSFRHETEGPSATPIADRHGVELGNPDYGKRRALRALHGSRAGALAIRFTTNALDLAPGTVFSIVGYPHPKLDDSKKLLVTQLGIEGDHDKEWTAQGSAVFADVPYHSPRRTPKPFIHGTHTAIVSGPKDREIFSDEFGRVRVQFPWDRDGKYDENSSCWVRAVQGWAGASYGLWTVPRIGQEVLVSYLGGDPDEPIIVGRVANALNPPPYPMPVNETKTVLRSQTTPGPDGFNEISFEDRKGYELFYERAERDREILTRHDERINVGRNRAKVVKGDEDMAILGSRREFVRANDHRTVKGEDREHIEGTKSVTVDGDYHLRVSGRLLIEAGGEIHLTSGVKIVLDSPDDTVNGGGGFMRATEGGVVLDGPAVVIKQGGAPGSGADSDPAAPELPTSARSYIGDPERPKLKKLPIFRSGQPAASSMGAVDYERDVICRAICGCNNAHNGTQYVSQWCVTLALWEYDKVLSHRSTIKAEVPYDMSQNPPTPIMSKNVPQRSTHGKPKGSNIPDVTVVWDPNKPPTQDNIKTVYEIKFDGDKNPDIDEMTNFKKIAGGAPVIVLRPKDCECKNDDPRDPPLLPYPVSAKDAAEIILLLLWFAGMVLDDALPGGQVDDVLIPGVIARLAAKLAPILSKLGPIIPPMLPVP